MQINTMQSITPTQFFEEGRSFNIELACRAWGDTIIPIRFWGRLELPALGRLRLQDLRKG